MSYGQALRCHHPRKRMIQYAAAVAFHHQGPGVLDRPVKPGDDIVGMYAIEAVAGTDLHD